jgi:hypothetical protein
MRLRPSRPDVGFNSERDIAGATQPSRSNPGSLKSACASIAGRSPMPLMTLVVHPFQQSIEVRVFARILAHHGVI